MSNKNNATCAICGKSYRVCMSCKDDIASAPWKKHTDTPEHYKIYQVIHGYSSGVYNKREAKAKLKVIDLSDYDSLRENIKAVIDDIRGASYIVSESMKRREDKGNEAEVETEEAQIPAVEDKESEISEEIEEVSEEVEVADDFVE